MGQFFSYLTLTVNIIDSSPKKHDKFRGIQAVELAERLAIDNDDDDEFEIGKGKNQIRTSKRAGDTRWGSHFGSLSSLMDLFSATCSVIKDMINDPESTLNQHSEADGVYDAITSFEFVFILHLMRETMEYTDDLCQALQRQSQDILNAMHLMTATKTQLQKFREDGWVPLLEKVTQFCEKHEISVPDMAAPYTAGRGRVRKDNINIGHHFRVEVFTYTIDSQWNELNNRFKEDTMELLILSTSLDP